MQLGFLKKICDVTQYVVMAALRGPVLDIKPTLSDYHQRIHPCFKKTQLGISIQGPQQWLQVSFLTMDGWWYVSCGSAGAAGLAH